MSFGLEFVFRLLQDDGSNVDFNSYIGLKIGGTYGDHKFTYTNDFTTFDDALDVGRDFIVKSDYIQLRVVPKTTQQDLVASHSVDFASVFNFIQSVTKVRME